MSTAMSCCCSLYALPRHFLPMSIRRTLASQVPFAVARYSDLLRSTTTNHPSASIHKTRVIACLRAQNATLALKAARAALRGGISVLEVVMSTPGVLEVVEKLIQEFPSSIIGTLVDRNVIVSVNQCNLTIIIIWMTLIKVGTVLNIKDARNAVNAGAKFLMSPCAVMEILKEIEASEILYIPGVMTPTEILSACNAGAKIVKIYPVSVLGCEKYVSTLKKPFPDVSMIASQGITIDSMRKYYDAGASAVVLSDAIFEKEAMKHEDYSAIHRLSKLANLHACQEGDNAY